MLGDVKNKKKCSIGWWKDRAKGEMRVVWSYAQVERSPCPESLWNQVRAEILEQSQDYEIFFCLKNMRNTVCLDREASN